MWPFKSKAQAVETRSSGSGYTSQIIAAREAYITGRDGVAELTATVQGAVSLWEAGLSLADVSGTDFLTPCTLALAARALALRGESVWLIEETGLVPASDWDLTTRNAKPVAYRLSIPDTGGGRTRTALAGEVLHLRIGADVSQPYIGTAPLRRAQLTAGLVQTIEAALSEVYGNAPLGSQIVPMPKMPEADMEKMARGFRGNRGRVLIRESVQVSAAGGPAPIQDWKSQDVTPDLSKAMTRETLSAARDSLLFAFGILHAMNAPAATGPLIREGQRHLAQWVLQPLAAMVGEEATAKLGQPVTLDVMQPLQAYDAGGRARALSQVVGAFTEAKSAGIEIEPLMKLVDWDGQS